MQELRTVWAAVTDLRFVVGIGFGAVAGVGGFVLRFVPAGWWLAGAATAALVVTGLAGWWSVVGVLLLGVAGWLSTRARVGPLAGLAAAVAVGLGGLALASQVRGAAWVAVLLVLGAVASGLAVDRVAGRAPRWSQGALVWLSVAGIWGAVPDTEAALVVMGVALPFVVVPCVLRRAGLPLAAVVAVTVAGGWSRPAALLGGLGCAAAVGLSGFPGLRPPRALPLLAVHVGVVTVASRVAAPRGVAVAALTVAAALAVGWLLLRIVGGRPA